jgi:hypothetical protein
LSWSLKAVRHGVNAFQVAMYILMKRTPTSPWFRRLSESSPLSAIRTITRTSPVTDY